MSNTENQAQHFPLQGQVAVVTGAARGIGEATAHALAGQGALVVLTSRDQARLEEVKAAIEKKSGRARVFACDLTNPAAVEALGKSVSTQFGRCDILVNNAGIGLLGKPLADCTVAEWDRILQTNLRGPFLTIRALVPLMIAARSGYIVNISSLAGRNPLPKGAIYSASKWGLNGLTYSLAEELRQYGIRVTAIAPGSVDTHFSGTANPAPGKGPGMWQEKDRSKMIRPADIAATVLHVIMQPPNAFVSEVLIRPTMKP